MNGIRLAQLHVAKGTRPIIDDIDELRITFGFGSIEVITGIVESRLRGGLKTNKPLSLNCRFTDRSQLNILMTFKDTFPTVPLEIYISIGNEYREQLQEFTDRILASPVEEEKYIRAVPLVKLILEEYDRVVPPVNNELVESINNVSVEDNTEQPATESIPELSQEQIDAEQKRIEEQNNTIFTCRMCRNVLFEFSELHPHTAQNHYNQKCTSYYLAEPPLNLKLFSQSDTQLATETDTSGKLLCTCKATVGHWSWTSHKCSCGEWITPVFQFVKRKLDVKKKT